LNGIEVYNRANPMTDVIIRNNKVTQDPNSKLENDDDDPARYRGYTAISILTNEKNHKWTKPLDKGRYVISNNTIEGLTKSYYEDGSIMAKETFVNGEMTSKELYYKNGNLLGNFTENDDIKLYYDDGSLILSYNAEKEESTYYHENGNRENLSCKKRFFGLKKDDL